MFIMASLRRCNFTYLLFFIALSHLGNLIATSHVDFQYPPGIISCKTYNETKLDCSKRMLTDIPPLDQNLTTLLNLRYNLLTEIGGKPFVKLRLLLYLDMSNNNIFSISSTAFSDLTNLLHLDLRKNMLVSLPEDIFVNLTQLLYLGISENLFTMLPPRLNWTTLHSLKYLQVSSQFDLKSSASLDIGESFQNMKNLAFFLVYDNNINSNITRNTFQYLSGLPLQTLFIAWFEGDTKIYIEDGIVLSLPSLQEMHIQLQMLNSFKFSCTLVRSIVLMPSTTDPITLDNSTLKNLAPWNSTLTHLRVYIRVEAIHDFAFKWTRRIVFLDLTGIEEQYLSKNAFFGLDFLEELTLAKNALSNVPSHTFHAFQSQSLRNLDLSFNGIQKIASDAFSLITSLKYLSLEGNPITVTGSLFDQLSNLISVNLDDIRGNGVGAGSSSLQILHCQRVTLPYLYFTWYIPNVCSIFPNLTHLSLSSPSIVEFPPPVPLGLYKCLQLEYLDLSDSTLPFDFGTRNSTLPRLQTFKFAENQLTSLKEISSIKANLTILDLSRNSLQTIEEISAYPDLVDLNLESNSLTSIKGLKHLKFLRHLNVANNQLTIIPSWMFHKTDSSVFSLKTLDLSSNPFQCTCDIEELRKWIVSDTETYLTGATTYACFTPKDLEGQSITAIELDCGSKVGFYIIVSIPCALVTLVIIGLLYKFRWHIKYKLHLLLRNYRQFPNLEEEFEMIEGNGPLQYHAYVAYNDDSRRDRDWVLDSLQPNIEEGPEPFKLCIKDRDFRGGQPLFETIPERVEQSRKTILVLTPQFLECNWCKIEMEQAQILLFEQERDVLVLVLLENIPERKITLPLRKLLCKKKYLKWPKDRVGQGLFWENLREELKTPVHVDKLC